MKYLIVVALLFAASCSSEPDVDWEQSGRLLKTTIDKLAAAGDCDGLRAKDASADHFDVRIYIEHKMREVGCID